MTDKILRMTPQQFGLILLGILFLPATLFFQPNLGGIGMSISHNITVWIAAVLVISSATFVLLKSKQFSSPSVWLAMAALPMSMIMLGYIVDSFLPTQWLFRQLYILGGFLFLIALFQFHFTNRDIETVLFILLISGIIHGFYGASQIFWPNILPLWITPSNEIPYSVFQQINMHASFQATILLVGFYLLSRPVTLKSGPVLKLILVSSIFLSCFTVAYSGSRTGLLASGVGVIILTLCNWRSFLNRKNLSSAVLISVIAALFFGSQGLQRGSQKLEDLTVKNSLGVAESGSNSRINIYKISIEVFLQQPLNGHGIGSFQKVWHEQKADYLERFPEANLPAARLSHPHNELLFWMVEGGGIAIGGILISVIAIIYASFSCGWRRGLNYIALLIPIGLHTLVELPFYISNIPWFLLLFLIFLILSHNCKSKPFVLSHMAELTVRWSVTILSLGITVVMLQTIQANHNTIRFLKEGMAEPALLQPALSNPFFSNTAEFYFMRTLLLRELDARQGKFAPQFIDWASSYIEYTPMPQLYIDLSRAYLATGDKAKAIETIEDGLARYPRIDRLKESARIIRNAANN
ncbi:PglL family O-oligosaccharyltransferase [Amphritea japonica]|uniref:O-antigen polymerase n=1 Tax=Amphritea japonica ATCC BAA-1530 TaxID=1278309 RepID=A0A7R6PE19_9GAMM|nr:O-antigen ligase family protein [Amphritea japonica]BBB26411.1 O-antigen polymerase [Amphritea japonica ATCC BAA-1530]